MLSRRAATTASPERAPEQGPALSSPAAMRTRRRRWSDPRLWLGALLVVGSVFIGAKVMAAADDTVAVWQVAHDLPAGSPVGADDLRVAHVHFDEASAAQQYVPVDGPVDLSYRAARDLHAGELLALTALSTGGPAAGRQVPLAVAAAHQPADLRAGEHVDVWAVRPAESGHGDGATSSLVLHDVVVLSAGSDATGVSGERQVLVAVGDQVDVGSVLRATTEAQVTLVRLAG